MLKGIKVLIVLNIIFYFNLFILSYKISLLGLVEVNPFWLVSPYFFAFILIYSLSRQYKIKRFFLYIDFVVRFIGIIINYIAGNQRFLSTNYIIFLLLVVFISMINLLIEIYMFKQYKKYYIENNIQGISFKDIAILAANENVQQQMGSTIGNIFISWKNWWSLIFSIVAFIFSIVFFKSEINQFKIIAIILVLIASYFTFKSLKSHIKIIDYVNNGKDNKNKRKIVNILGVVISFAFVFCITYFGGKELGYANAFSAVFLIPLYRTEKAAVIKSKEELDSTLDKYKNE